MPLLRPLLMIILLGCWFGSEPLRAAGLLEAEVPVADMAEASRAEGVRAALLQVLVKNTGIGDLALQADTAALLRNPEQGLQQYGYAEVPGAEGEPRQVLRVRFSREDIERRIHAQGLPLWSAQRPRLLLWVAIEDARGRTLQADDDSPYAASLRRQAERRGLPIALPLLDMQDRRQISVADVWGGFEEIVHQASQRYDGPGWATATLRPATAGQWRLQWTLQLDEWQLQGSALAASVELALRRLVDELADEVAARYAVSPAAGGESRLRIAVLGVQGYGDYVNALRYLRGLDLVSGVQPQSLRQQEVIFTLRSRASKADLARLIDLGARFDRLSQSPVNDDVDLHYKIQP